MGRHSNTIVGLALLLVSSSAFVPTVPASRRFAKTTTPTARDGGRGASTGALSMNFFANALKGVTSMFDKAAPPEDVAVVKTPEEWREVLTKEQYVILRQAGTEAPWSSPYNEEKREGIFNCAACGHELFTNDAKFESGSGWPSFFQPIRNGAILERRDMTLGMPRTETLCANCGGHLGHSFPDGPRPTGIRYCMNGVSLDFKPTGPDPTPPGWTGPPL